MLFTAVMRIVRGHSKIRRQDGMGGQSNVYTNKANDLLLISFVKEGWMNGPKGPKICLGNC